MHKNLKPVRKTGKTADNLNKTKAIHPFTELPASDSSITVKLAEPATLSPFDLFSHFTANIIREKSVFVR